MKRWAKEAAVLALAVLWGLMLPPPSGGLPLVTHGSSVIVWPDGPPQLRIFVAGADGRLLEGSEADAAWSWTDHGMPPETRLATSPAALTWLNGPVAWAHVFALGENGHLVEKRWSGGAWSWTDHGLAPAAQPPSTLAWRPVSEAETPAAVAWLAGGTGRRVHAFVKTLDGRLAERTWDGAAWRWIDHGWPGGGRAVSRPLALLWRTSPVRVSVFAVGENGHLVERQGDGSLWSWIDHGTAPGGAAFTGSPGGFAWQLGTAARLNVFCRAGGSRLIERWFDGSVWRTSEVDGIPAGPSGGATLADGIAVAAWQEGGVDRFSVFAVAGPGRLLERHWDGARWTWREHSAPAGSRLEVSASPGAAAWPPGALARWSAFLVRRDGSLLERSAQGGSLVWNDQRGPASAPASPEVERVRSPQPIQKDPALLGEPWNPGPLPAGEPPGEMKDPVARRLLQQLEMQPASRFQLAPRQSRQVKVVLDEPSWIFVNAHWFGSTSPVELVVRQGGATLARGHQNPVPPLRGSAHASAEARQSGQAVVTLTNKGLQTVRVEVLLGTLPAAALR